MSLGMLGKYERLGILGRGVSGIVYLAKDTLLNRQVALKEVDVQAGDLRRFLEEARVMDRLRHPNIVRVNGIDRIEDKVVIDMEYVRGGNLQEALRARGPLSIESSLDIAIQVLDALEYAHSMQTVHRDIKPANILLQRDGTAKLADFGLAEILATNAYVCGAGTYAYMAPEDFAEESHSDAQSDIWAVAVTLFEMMTGERPFYVTNPKSPFAWKRALETQEPRTISSILPHASPALDRAVARGLASNKENRFLTAGEFRTTLVRVLETEYPRYQCDRSEETAPETALYPKESDDRWRSHTARTAVTTNEPNPWTQARSVTAPANSPLLQTLNSLDSGDTVAAVPVGSIGSMEAGGRSKRKILGRNREAQLAVWPHSLSFGAVRQGDERTAKLCARSLHLDGDASGRIASKPDWVTVHPQYFESSKQNLTVTVNAELAPGTGIQEASVRIETRAGCVDVPVVVNVLKPRLTFRQIAWWYVPLFGLALTPSIVTAALAEGSQLLAPPAAATSFGLGLMLLLITAAADTGIWERLACGVMMAGMSIVLGVNMGTPHGAGYNGQMERGLHWATGAGTVLGLVVIAQLLTLKRWRFWGFVLAFTGVLVGGACYRLAGM